MDKDVRDSCRGIFKAVFQYLPEETKRIHQNSQSLANIQTGLNSNIANPHQRRKH